MSGAKSKALLCKPETVSESGMKWTIVDTPKDSLQILADELGVK